MDKSERYVKKIACTVASFPLNDPTGKFFDYDRTQMYMDNTKELNIRFKCMGVVYNDDIIIKWFNTCGTYTNSDIRKIIDSKFKIHPSHTYEPIPHQLLSKFRYQGYPLINTETFELQWWVDFTTPGYASAVAAIPGGTIKVPTSESNNP